MNWLLDTNIVLYFLGGRLTQPLPDGTYHVSIITEIELLSYPELDDQAERQIRSFLNAINVVGLTHAIKDTAIVLRRRLRLKVPDAIIAASAIIVNAELLTNDGGLLSITDFKSRPLPLQAP